MIIRDGISYKQQHAPHHCCVVCVAACVHKKIIHFIGCFVLLISSLMIFVCTNYIPAQIHVHVKKKNHPFHLCRVFFPPILTRVWLIWALMICVSIYYIHAEIHVYVAKTKKIHFICVEALSILTRVWVIWDLMICVSIYYIHADTHVWKKMALIFM